VYVRRTEGGDAQAVLEPWALERRLVGVRPKRWLGVLAAALALSACAGSETGSPTRTVPPGAAFQSIAQAVVRSDDQTIVVNASWGGCQKRPYLVATESTSEVTLALVEPPVVIPSDVACPLFLARTQVQTTLNAQLGPRHLIDRSVGRSIPTVHEDQLADVTEIPAGFHYTGIAPGAMVGVANGQPLLAATRTYSTTDTTMAPLQIIQFPGTSASEGETYWGVEAMTVVHGRGAIVQSDPSGANPAARSLTWLEGGWVFVLASLSGKDGQRPLSEAELLSVGQGLQVLGGAPR
jgi:hypothetical protein